MKLKPKIALIFKEKSGFYLIGIQETNHQRDNPNKWVCNDPLSKLKLIINEAKTDNHD